MPTMSFDLLPYLIGFAGFVVYFYYFAMYPRLRQSWHLFRKLKIWELCAWGIFAICSLGHNFHFFPRWPVDWGFLFLGVTMGWVTYWRFSALGKQSGEIQDAG